MTEPRSSVKKLRELLTDIRDGRLLPSPDFQRRLVWTNKHKVALIRTVLDGYPFPEVYLADGELDADTANAKVLLVDGQQRLTTLYDYFTGSEGVKLERGVAAYADLPEGQKKAFLQYAVVVRDLGSASRTEIIDVFTRINSTGYALNPMEIRNARFDGALKRFAEEIASLDFFSKHKVFTATDGRRMNDLRFVLWVIITCISSYFHRDAELERYLEMYNDRFPHKSEVQVWFNSVLSFIEDMDLPDSSRGWQRADFFTLCVELQRALHRDKLVLEPAEVAERLEGFWVQVNAADAEPDEEDPDRRVYDYYASALQASNDRTSRRTRGEILGAVLRGLDGRLAAGGAHQVA